MKRIIIPLILFVLICGCSQPAHNVEIVPAPVTVVPTFLTPSETVGPVPTKDESAGMVVVNATFDPMAG